MNVVRILGKKKGRVRIDRIRVDSTPLNGCIVVCKIADTLVEVTSIGRINSPAQLVKLLEQSPELIRLGVNVEWLQDMQPRIDAALVEFYENRSENRSSA
jgi:hypothetical protein